MIFHNSIYIIYVVEFQIGNCVAYAVLCCATHATGNKLFPKLSAFLLSSVLDLEKAIF